MPRKKWSLRIYLQRRWKQALWIAAIILILGQILNLSNQALRGLENLSTAPSDDIRWNLSQVEVELLRLESSVHRAQVSPAPDLKDVRTRFDIFYGRLMTVGDSPIYAALREDPVAKGNLAAAQQFLADLVPYIDGSDTELAAALDEIGRRTQRLVPEIRSLTLAGISRFAEAADQRRTEIFNTMRELALTGVVLVAGLLLSMLLVQRLYVQGRRAARSSETARNRFEAAVSSSLDAILVVNTDGQIVEFNGGAEEIFGYSREEAIGADMAEMIVPPELRAAHHAGMNHYLTTRERKLVGQGRIRITAMRKSGEIFPVELSISSAATGKHEVFVAYIRDITPELKAEEELREARDKAQAGEKAKSQLLTVMSHEMRTPLNGILGSLELIRGDNLTERQQRLLRAIGVSGELLLSHVNNVLDLSRLDSDQAESRRASFDLAELIQNLIDSLRPAAGARGNELRSEFVGGRIGMVTGDKRGLQQCLVNLIGNAVKFTRDGVISVEIEKLARDNMVEFRISDTGVGISEENIDRIFEEFVTIDTAYARENPGTGLGLPITARLIKALGGSIDVQSLEGEGSMFTMRVPLVQGKAQPAIEREDADANEVGQCPLHVLIVEDNEVNRMILEHMLGDLGCSFESADGGDKGIELARKGHFDLLLLDISMPGKDGLQTLTEIRELPVPTAKAPAIAITAHTGRQDRERILAKFDDMLIKPITLARLTQKLAAHSDQPERTESGKDLAADFIARFGEDAYREQLGKLTDELTELAGQLDGAAELLQGHRDAAHRIAGAAAVLGQMQLHKTLQYIETLPEQDWRGARSDILIRLDRERNSTGI
ncbi:hybrid sensor histidine kinase/response regulator [Paracoccus seriniphilus]|uniref:hybrid sensor histidine kinase/response regulator n=1 Tax=Paracoccus seriniphilus TaxID=184748 RepID=UPI003568AD5E